MLFEWGRNQSFGEIELVTMSLETSTFLNSLVLYNDLSKLEREGLLPEIMKSISKITPDLVCNKSLMSEFEIN